MKIKYLSNLEKFAPLFLILMFPTGSIMRIGIKTIIGYFKLLVGF